MEPAKTLEEEVVELLARKHLTVTTAESCTGGLIAGTLINAAGASDVLNEGYVTYSNEAKERLVHVSHETLERYGAVSVRQRGRWPKAQRARGRGGRGFERHGDRRMGRRVIEKPVGLVYVGCCLNGRTVVKECRFNGSRMENRLRTVETALTMLKEQLI